MYQGASPLDRARGAFRLAVCAATRLTTKGRFVLAATEHLHRRIAKMSERIHQLEDALAILQAKCTNDPHPLLSDSKGKAHMTDDDDDFMPQDMGTVTPTDVVSAFGMLSVSDHGVSRFFGPTGGTEVGTLGSSTCTAANTLGPLSVPPFRMSFLSAFGSAPHRSVFSQMPMAPRHQVMVAGPQNHFAAPRRLPCPTTSLVSRALSRSLPWARHTACTSSLRATFHHTNVLVSSLSHMSLMRPGCSGAYPDVNSSTR